MPDTRHGGYHNLRRIDPDLNLILARAARAAGVSVYVLITIAGANKDASSTLRKDMGIIEATVTQLDFDKIVFLRPGLIIGAREQIKLPEYGLWIFMKAVGMLTLGWSRNFRVQEADVVGRAAVVAGLKCFDGTAPPGKVWTLDIDDINRLGKR